MRTASHQLSRDEVCMYVCRCVFVRYVCVCLRLCVSRCCKYLALAHELSRALLRTDSVVRKVEMKCIALAFG